MVYKRPSHGEETFEVGCKQARQELHTAPESPIWGVVHCNDSPQELHSGEGENTPERYLSEKKTTRELVSEYLNGANEELGKNGYSSISIYPWVNADPDDDYADPEAPLMHANDSILLNHSSRKVVPIGRSHQADVPEWTSDGNTTSSGCLYDSDEHVVLAPSGTRIVDVGDNGVKWTGVIPMRDMESSTHNFYAIGGTRNICSCLDMGSTRCVRQHVTEAREKLRENFGPKVFEELGFCDMGEDVAKKWKEREQQLFNEVVLSNPASMGNKFWDQLSIVFPTRMKKELVSYYFNVFMLRQFAEQSRFDPLNIDSYDDEWQISKLWMTEEENLDEELLGGNEMDGERAMVKDYPDFYRS